MRSASATFRKARLAAGLLLFVAPTPALAQDMTMRDALHSSYSLWGMMDGIANFCAEVMQGDFAYSAAYIDWLTRNIIIVDELNAALAQSGEPTSLSDEGRTAGSDGILELVRPAVNHEEICMAWKAETERGAYEAETFLAVQLGLLRERDGM